MCTRKALSGGPLILSLALTETPRCLLCLVSFLLLQREEAIQSAIEEFKMQGIDLSNIVTLKAGSDISEHPLARAVDDVKSSLSKSNPPDFSTVVTALSFLIDLFSQESEQEITAESSCYEAILMATRAMDVVLGCLREMGAASTTDEDLEVALSALHAMVTRSIDMKKAFISSNGECLLHKIAERDPLPTATVMTRLLNVAAAAAAKHEDGKVAAFEQQLGSCAITSLRSYEKEDSVVVASCSLIISLTSADDETQPTSKAFVHARSLAKSGALDALLNCLANYEDLLATSDIVDVDATISLCSATRQIAANDEICKAAAEGNVVRLVLDIIRHGLSRQQTGLLRAALSLLRQLASSDAIKIELVEEHDSIFVVLYEVLTFASDLSYASILEQAFGLIANLTLRRPDAAEKLVTTGCYRGILDGMQTILNSHSNGSCNSKDGNSSVPAGVSRRSAALRQGCMAVRNMASRSSEVRQTLLQNGADAVVVAAKEAYPRMCEDVASAALRDLSVV